MAAFVPILLPTLLIAFIVAIVCSFYFHNASRRLRAYRAKYQQWEQEAAAYDDRRQNPTPIYQYGYSRYVWFFDETLAAVRKQLQENPESFGKKRSVRDSWLEDPQQHYDELTLDYSCDALAAGGVVSLSQLASMPPGELITILAPLHHANVYNEAKNLQSLAQKYMALQQAWREQLGERPAPPARPGGLTWRERLGTIFGYFLLTGLVGSLLAYALFTYLPGASGPSNASWQPTITALAGVDMALVPAGCFPMGKTGDAEGGASPQHEQCFAQPFWIDRTEVTQGQFERLGGTKMSPAHYAQDSQPVAWITWFEARDFCSLRGARLPTEAEWEYAGRGPDGLRYPWGNELDNSRAVLSVRREPEVVASLPAGDSWVGASDMIGNVNEWVSTIYGIYDYSTFSFTSYFEYPYREDDGREAFSTDRTYYRVVRGGSFQDSFATLTDRKFFAPDITDDTVGHALGFRCARDAE